MSSIRQWRKLALGLILVWALVFLGLLSYILDTHVDEPVASPGSSSSSSSSSLSQHPDTRRLASLQALTHQQPALIDSRPDPLSPFTTVYPEMGRDSLSTSTTMEPSLEQSRSPDSAPYSQETGLQRQNYLDTDSLATWSSFGTENIASYPDTVTRNRARTSAAVITQRHQKQGSRHQDGGEEEEEEEEDEEVNAAARKTTVSHATEVGVESSEPEEEEYFFPRTASLVQQLWRGRVSAAMLSPRLQRAMKDYLAANKHHVAFTGQRRLSRSPKELLCQMKRQARPRTVDGSEQPFAGLGWAGMVPTSGLEELYKKAGHSGFSSCAVVTSAGAVLHSGLGQEIDSHDAVLRFNAAPTEGFERDVGSNTTIRVINSQILANPNHRFNTSSLYKNVTLVAWDPAPYSVNLEKWYASPDYNLFSPYVEHRKLQPSQPFYILHPSYVWSLWDVIQSNTQEDIQPNPPSSGFIGILLMMALCEQVHVYEYIPSLRQTDLCHYHERYYDTACTLGAYHPLLFEKNLIQRINTGTQNDVKRRGRVTLPGFKTVQCP